MPNGTYGPEKVSVRRKLFDAIGTGDVLELAVHDGALGMAWLEVLARRSD